MKVSKELQGLGMDDASVQSMPLIKILQKSAAEVDETHQDHATKKVPGAKPGDIYFMGEQLLLGTEIEVIPLAIKAMYAEWRPQSQGGGLVAHHEEHQVYRNPNYRKGTGEQKYKEYLGDNDLKLTYYFCVLFKHGEEWKKGIVSLTSSNLKHARGFVRNVTNFRYADAPGVKPPIFARSYKMRTFLERGKGNSWFEFNIEPTDFLVNVSDPKDALVQLCVNSRSEAVASLPEAAPVAALTAGVEEDPY